MTRKFLTPVVLPADPAAPMEAATKQYVDALTAAAGNEVFVGADDPGITYEVWYDTDAGSGDTTGSMSAWTDLTPATNYGAPDNSYQILQYKKIGNVGFVQGGMKNVSGGGGTNTMTTLPVGCRPLVTSHYAAVKPTANHASLTASWVLITSAGLVQGNISAGEGLEFSCVFEVA